MGTRRVSRRKFLAVTAAGAALPLAGCPRRRTGVTVFRRSGRGRHLSNAAKKHAANHLYKTEIVAMFDLAHPGDKAKVVPVVISQERFDRLFGNGNFSVDLRHV